MKLVQLKMHGFMSFTGDTLLKFEKGVTYIVGTNLDEPDFAESNGSGKTTILSAVSWALFGSCPGGISKDDVISHGRELVEVELLTDRVHIIRAKPRNRSESLRYKGTDGIWKQADSLKETQSGLLELLGIGAGTFYNTVYFHNKADSSNFLELTPAARSGVMATVIDDSLFQNAARLVSSAIDTINSDLKGHDVFLRELDYQEGKLRDERNELEKELNARLLVSQDRKEKAANKIAQYRKKIQEEMENFVDVTTYNLEELYAKKQTIRKKLRGVSAELGAVTGSLGEVSTLQPGSDCPLCLRTVDISCLEVLRLRKRENEERRRSLGEMESTLQEQLTKVESWIDKTKDQEAKKDTALERINTYRAEIRLLEDKLDATGDTVMLEGLLKENTAHLAELESRRAESMKEHEQAQNELPLLKELKKAFQSDLRNILLDRVREGLKYYGHRYLYMLAEGMKLEYPATSHTGAEKFEIYVYNGKYKQELSAYSGGESWKLRMAILLSLRCTLLENRNPWDFLMIDDPVGELDPKGLVCFLEMLETLKTEIPQILVTVPRDLSSEGHRLEVTKKGGSSTCGYR